MHLRISGRVQGVWFRGWTVDTASALGLDGWVRNRRDGTVEAVAAGETGQVDAFVKACHDGPPGARVDAVNVDRDASEPEPGFRQLPTA